MSRNFGKNIDRAKSNDNNIRNFSNNRIKTPIKEREGLVNFRVIQRDLVYAIGIPLSIAHEETLYQYEYFGQYGSIKKIVVNSQSVHNNNTNSPTVSVFVTFFKHEDALECIYSLENYNIDNHLIKASLGTSKYCSSFLSGQKCTNSDCTYLHQNGDPSDSFSTEEIQNQSSRFVELSRPTRPSDYLKYTFQDKISTIFPPRRIFNTNINEEEDKNLNFDYDDEEFEYQQETFGKILSNINYIIINPLKIDYDTNSTLELILNLN